jgi:hypothetical protein
VILGEKDTPVHGVERELGVIIRALREIGGS